MATARVIEELPASADAAWACLAAFCDMSAWSPDSNVVRSEGTGLGAVRVVDGADGRYVERCEAYDPVARSFRYSLVESPHNYDRYLGEVTLTPLGDDRCRIEWSSDFEIGGVPIERVAKACEAMYRDYFISNLRKTLEGRVAAD